MSQVQAFRSLPTKILLPTDFSPSSHAALAIAADLALHFHAKLYLLNVIHLLPAVSGADFFAETEVFQKSKRNAEETLAACEAALAARSISVVRRVEAANDVAASILAEIEREHIDMLVLSTHGMSGWRPLVFGSIAEKLVRAVKCPLLLLRSSR